MKINKKILFFSYFLFLFFLLFEILFSKKNIFVFMKNLELIEANESLLAAKKEIHDEHASFLDDFKNSKKFREIVIKDKLFYKNPNEMILRYEFNPK
tara:strand:- start:1513 stop:1803 length:291 start_codon:yes stop_codon:yes gene_type:complete